MEQKLKYIDGVKGLACIGVFFFHYYTSFCQQVTNIAFDSTKIDVIFTGMLRPFTDGSLMVMIFALISGWLVGHTRISNREEVLKRCFIRYARFVLSILPSLLLIKLLYVRDLFYSHKASEMLGISQLAGVYSMTFANAGGVLEQGLYRILFVSDSSWNAPLWMLSSIFWGSVFVYILKYLKVKIEETVIRRGVCLCFLTLVFVLFDWPALTVLIGACLFWKEDKIEQIDKKIVMGSGPLSVLMVWGVNDVIYDLVTKWIHLPRSLSGSGYVKVIWATGLFLMLLRKKRIQRIFSIKVLVYLGRVSFPVYLLHWPLMCSFSAYFLCNITMPYAMRFWLVLLITLITLVLISTIYYLTIERLASKLTDYLKIKLL